MGELLDALLTKKDNTYSVAIRGTIARMQQERYENHYWSGRIPVGSISSWGACPKEIIVKKQQAFRSKVKTVYKMEQGTLIHERYQKAAMNTPNLKWIKPYNIPDCILKNKDGTTTTLLDRLHEVWPEIPVTYRDSEGEVIIIGYADEVENYFKKPVVLDIKSNNEDPVMFVQKYKPLPMQIQQAKCYAILMNLDKYYSPFVIDQVKILAVNTRMEAGDPEAEKETYARLTDEDFTMFNLFARESVDQIHAFDKKKDRECKYKGCANHAGYGLSTMETTG